MTLPYIQITPVQGSAAPVTANSKALVIGPSSAGLVANKLYTFATVGAVSDAIGYGPAQIQAELLIASAPAGFGSVDVIVAPATETGAGIVEFVTGTMTNSIHLGGNPTFSMDVVVDVTQAGGYGEGRFRYSLDGGYSWANNITIPNDGKYTMPTTGLSASFLSASYPVGTKNVSRVEHDYMNASDLASAVAFLSSSNTNYTWVVVADDVRDPSKNLFSQADASMTSLNDTYFKHTQLVLPVGGEDRVLTEVDNGRTATPAGSVVNAIKTLASSEGNFISVVAERARVLMPVPRPGFTAPSLPFSMVVASLYQNVGNDISKNPAVDPMNRVLSTSYDEFLNGSVYHDEGIVAPRTFQGNPGFWINQAKLKATPNNAWYLVPHARVTSVARSVLRSSLQKWLNRRVRVLKDGTGRIDPRDKARVETDVNKALRTALLTGRNLDGFNGHVTDLSFVVNSENNILTTGLLQGNCSIIPFAYITAMEITISLDDSIPVQAV